MAGLFDGTPLEQPVTCEVCDRALSQCECKRGDSGDVLLPKDQPVRMGREKRRKGKTVTVVHGLDPSASNLEPICAKLNTACGAGGTIKVGKIEIQGDHCERVLEIFLELGYPAKLIGG
jgi:translation initiation factor 1